MFGLLKRWFGGGTLRVDAYWCGASIKLPNKIKTPGGSNISVVTVCVDVDYAINNGQITVKDVRLSRGGGRITGSRTPLNIAAERTGEAWYASSFSPKSLLLQVVRDELALEDSGLRKIMFGKWRAANQGSLVGGLVDALNSNAPPEQIAQLIETAGRGNDIVFTYTKTKGGSETRRVTVRGVKGKSIRATDHKDGSSKLFRIDRISNARRA